MTVHIWNEHKIEIKSRAVRRMAWFGVSLSALIDDGEVFESPKHFEGFRTVVPFNISEGNEILSGRVETGRPCSVLLAKYRIYVGDEEVASGSVRASNWHVTYSVIGLVYFALVLSWFVRHT